MTVARTIRQSIEAFLASNAGAPGCWLYPGYLDKDGYAEYRRDGKFTRAHRAAFASANGPIPDGAYVLHKCDNRGCCRPDHLFLGDAKANAEDARRKGRNSRGERNGQSKFTEMQVSAIRADTRTQWEIARSYGVWQSVISSIKRRESWKHVK